MPYRLKEDGSFAYDEADRANFARERAAAAGVDWDETYESEADARAAAARINRACVAGLQLRVEVEPVRID